MHLNIHLSIFDDEYCPSVIVATKFNILIYEIYNIKKVRKIQIKYGKQWHCFNNSSKKYLKIIFFWQINKERKFKNKL